MKRRTNDPTTAEPSSAAVSRPRPRGGKPSRAEKVEQTRLALLRAAAEVVGERGYQGAMVSEITARAKVAQGTFYNYFGSLKELLDQLLPEIGHRMLDYVRTHTEGETEAQREGSRFYAYFQFLHQYPEFYRILFEAEVFAPEAFHEHRETVGRGFSRVLARAQESGELQPYEPRELEVLAYMLMGARHYLSMRYARKGDGPARFPRWVVDAYLKFLCEGLFHKPAVAANAARETPPSRPRRTKI